MKESVFECKRCGYCCHGDTTVSLDKNDQTRMLKILNMTRQEAFEKYWIQRGNQVQMKIVDGHCVFYRDGCSIHEGRPWRCREWPMVKALNVGETNLITIKESCPGIRKDASHHDISQEVNIVQQYLNSFRNP